jgi:ribonuclease HI
MTRFVTAIKGLQALRGQCEVKLITDSESVSEAGRHGVSSSLPRRRTNGWRTPNGKPAQRKDLLRASDKVARRVKVVRQLLWDNIPNDIANH